jgi:hypothetical protein
MGLLEVLNNEGIERFGRVETVDHGYGKTKEIVKGDQDYVDGSEIIDEIVSELEQE